MNVRLAYLCVAIRMALGLHPQHGCGVSAVTLRPGHVDG